MPAEVDFPSADMRPAELRAEDLEAKSRMQVKPLQASASSPQLATGSLHADSFRQHSQVGESLGEHDYEEDFVEESGTLNMTSTMTQSAHTQSTQESGRFDSEN